MTFTVTHPRAEDADAIADLHVSTWREAYGVLLGEDFFTEQHLQMRREMWQRILGNPREGLSVRVATIDGEIVGFALAGPGVAAEGNYAPRERQLYAIYVAAAHYGTGIGQALLDEILGTEPAMLWVAKQNARAIAFYRRNGFEFDGAEQIDPGAPRITDARMIR